MSESRIFELIKCSQKAESSGNVVVMHPEINGIKEEQEKIRIRKYERDFCPGLFYKKLQFIICGKRWNTG